MSLDRETRRKFVNALMKLQVTTIFQGRSSLLAGLPNIAINRSESMRQLDLTEIVTQYGDLGRDQQTGRRPLVMLAENAMDNLGDWEGDLYDDFNDLLKDLNNFYAGEPNPATELPQIDPEKLLFKGRDERVSLMFVQRALESSRSIARFMVPRYFNGNPDTQIPHVYGTGWLIAPGTMITNHHVIEARDRNFEAPASAADFKIQAENTTVWFDYFNENGPYLPCEKATLLASNEQLDYAVIRLTEADKVADRSRLPIVVQTPQMSRGNRLNIVQHSGGGPLIYAIRNNFYVGEGNSADYLRYLTDTEGGSSGSPILNDFWNVIGLHHAAVPISPETYADSTQPIPKETSQGQVITYHNQGIAIHSILNDLPADLRSEIAQAQGWSI